MSRVTWPRWATLFGGGLAAGSGVLEKRAPAAHSAGGKGADGDHAWQGAVDCVPGPWMRGMPSAEDNGAMAGCLGAGMGRERHIDTD
jgi:hypothetical protein